MRVAPNPTSYFRPLFILSTSLQNLIRKQATIPGATEKSPVKVETPAQGGWPSAASGFGKGHKG